MGSKSHISWEVISQKDKFIIDQWFIVFHYMSTHTRVPRLKGNY